MFPTKPERSTGDGRSISRINSPTVRERDLADFLSKAGIFEGAGEFEKKKQKALEDLDEVELHKRRLRFEEETVHAQEKIKRLNLFLHELSQKEALLKQAKVKVRKDIQMLEGELG